jgi:hypothetical protein
MERIEHIDSKECKGQKTITIHLKGGNEPRLMLSPQVGRARSANNNSRDSRHIPTFHRLVVFSCHCSSSRPHVCMFVVLVSRSFTVRRRRRRRHCDRVSVIVV